MIPIRVPTLIGGVSRSAQSQRPPQAVQEADNVSLSLTRGLEKRAGTVVVRPDAVATISWAIVSNVLTITFASAALNTFAAGQKIVFTSGTVFPFPGTVLTVATKVAATITASYTHANASATEAGSVKNTGQLNVTDPTNTKHIGWIDRDATERFVYFIDPAQGTSDNEMVEIFTIDGLKQSVLYGSTNPRSYIANGTGDARRRLRSLTIADATFILNKTKLTALSGAAITYKDEAAAVNWRNQNSANNKASWASFPQPPTGIVSPVGDTSDDFIYYAREADVGQPSGFYAAVSTTQPPWYERIRTEGANSLIDETTMPVQITFDGTDFTVQVIDWTDRLAGDSATNPGPAFIGNELFDLALYQGRMFFASGERLISSQASDLFNLWISDPILLVDSDPVSERLSNNRVCNIEHLVSFRETMLALTSGGRQFELRADGPMSPNTAVLLPTTSYQTVQYVSPAVLGDQVYFAGERNFANTLYEYYFDPDHNSNIGEDITQAVEGYLPAEISRIEASESHDTLFILTDAEPNNIYVYKTKWSGNQRVMASWFRWVTDEDNEILSCKTFGEDLYLVIRRDDVIWMEKVAIETPEQDTNGNLTMTYAVRLDRKERVLGTYDPVFNETTWTLPYEDDTLTDIVLGEEWDVDSGGIEQRLKATRLSPTITVQTGFTTYVVTGQYATNIAGTAAEVYIGRPFTMDVQMSQQFVRDQNNNPLYGNTQILSGRIRHKDTGYYRIEITPFNRETKTHEFIFPRIGSTAFDGVFLDENGEFKFRVMASAATVAIHIINDSPMPCNIVDMEFSANFVPQSRTPTR